jgi:hypothetical protein
VVSECGSAGIRIMPNRNNNTDEISRCGIRNIRIGKYTFISRRIARMTAQPPHRHLDKRSHSIEDASFST